MAYARPEKRMRVSSPIVITFARSRGRSLTSQGSGRGHTSWAVRPECLPASPHSASIRHECATGDCSTSESRGFPMQTMLKRWGLHGRFGPSRTVSHELQRYVAEDPEWSVYAQFV